MGKIDLKENQKNQQQKSTATIVLNFEDKTGHVWSLNSQLIFI